MSLPKIFEAMQVEEALRIGSPTMAVLHLVVVPLPRHRHRPAEAAWSSRMFGNLLNHRDDLSTHRRASRRTTRTGTVTRRECRNSTSMSMSILRLHSTRPTEGCGNSRRFKPQRFVVNPTSGVIVRQATAKSRLNAGPQRRLGTTASIPGRQRARLESDCPSAQGRLSMRNN